jgi:molybdenum cofactor cytidylyltransferase
MTEPSTSPAERSERTDAPPGEVWGVLLAAGTSSRFGDRNKLLATVDGQPMVRQVAETLLDAELAGVVAVVGYESAAVSAALDGLDVVLVENDSYEEGLSTSVRHGLNSAVAHGADAVLFALSDMPDVSSETVDALVAAYRDGAGTAIAATYEGDRGNPVLFDETHFEELLTLTGDVGGRHILETASNAAFVETGDPGVRRDIDTVSEYRSGHDG